ncbi:hypothetical protein F2Q70_00023041 [Brassica cretica]|uniref:Uncharacterized protein n=1 Tax=Brassica cretica TaxID=69181 RepID=A0A8S9GIQ8_BRACR|nr:hypothetical protein F2Q70_00023041 [Brassica cretica]
MSLKTEDVWRGGGASSLCSQRVKKTKDVWRDAVDEDDDVMRLMIIQLRFRFSAKGGALIGLELLIIDEQGTVIQGFMALSVLSGVDHMCLPMYDDQFRFHVHEDFESNCGLRGDLYGVRCGWPHEATEWTIVHSPSGPVMKLYLWDQAATVFYKFTASADTSVILLVMTLNPKRIRGRELTGKHASEFVYKYFEANGDLGRTQAITVMKVVSPSVLQPLTSPVGIPLATTSEMPLFSASD